ncbi:LLM class flavin-dependent oxidoreductase [Micromonospora matsumotoense]|uniref:LLM class flavin-dependent oxidoreductase n=1 Tax=Micromonospora matsumotoense TaxID=121616 RepID=UPI003437F096
MTVSFPVSVLDVVPVWNGSTATRALRDSLDLAVAVEQLGYTRYWVAEHHNTPCLATATPPVLVGALLAATRTLRVGSGGVLLPNHAPLVVAEQFGTLAALHPGRVDLGVGRAPGTDAVTARALRRAPDGADQFPGELAELLGYFGPTAQPRAITAVAAAESTVPVWVLGSSPGSARLAGSLGLPYAFAHQISPTLTASAFAVYRESFRPSGHLDRPHAILSAVVVAGESDEHAEKLIAPYLLGQIRLRTSGRLDPFPTAAEEESHRYTAPERAFVADRIAGQVVGGPETLRRRVAQLRAETGADELMALTILPDATDRRRSYALLADAVRPAVTHA